MGIYAKDVQKLYIAYFNRPADVLGLAYWEEQVAKNGGSTAAIANAFSASAEYKAIYDGKSTADIINTIYTNIFGRAAEPAAITYWGTRLDNGTFNIGNITTSVMVGAQNDDKTTIDNKTTAADLFTTNLDTSAEIIAYSGATANATAKAWLAGVTSVASTLTAATASVGSTITTIAAGTVANGTTFTLTTAADTLTGTANNDTFVALVDAATPANSTLSATDTINGSSGTGDVLNITTQAGTAIADAANSALISGIETVNLRATSTAGVTLAAGNISGMTTLNNNLSTDAVTVTGLASTTALKITGNGTVTNGATTATYAASATAGAVTLAGGTTAGAVAVNGAGFTSFTVTSTGATNTIGALSSSGTSIATTTINAETAFLTTGLTVGTVAAGGQKLVVSGAAGDRAASATSAARSAVTVGAIDADFVSVDASGMTAGGFSGTLSATTTATFKGGVGSDRIVTSTSGQTGEINAGSGTDTLTLAASTHIDTTAEGAIYKGFEVLAVADGVSFDMDLITGSTITAVALADAGSATVVSDLSATQAANFTIAALDGAATIGVKDATVVATIDTLNITVSDGDTTSSEAITVAGDLTIAGVENINITATDDVTLATMANVTGVTSLKVTGAGDVSITTGAMAASANLSVDFSGLTSATTFNFAAATGNAIGFTGSAFVDTVTDSAIGGNVITTGSGADVITLTAKTGGTAGDIITGGAGADTLTVTAAKGNDAQDTLTLKYAAGDSVIDASVTGTGFVATKMDAVNGIDFATVAAATTGHVITFDTVQSATAVTFASSALTFGTTTVTNAFDFYVYNTGAGGITYVYQDTDGDKIIEDGEFGVQLTGAAATASTSGEFAVTTGNLVLTTVAG